MLIASRYMTRFRCLAADCPDDCCHGWRVLVDREHLDKLRQALPPEEAAAKLRPIESNDPQRVALVVLDGQRRCSFLDGGLCSIQSRFGEDHLPDACATFPRRVGRLGDGYELQGSLSCPEVARLVLEEPDALDLVPAPREMFGRNLVHHKVEGPAVADFVRVREHLLDVLGWDRYSLPVRLFTVAVFGLAGPVDLDDARERLATFEPPGPFAMSVVRAIVELPAFRAFDVPPGDDAVALDEEHRRRARHDVVDEWLARYARHYVLREWFPRASSPSAYVLGLLVRVAILRYLIREPSPELARRAVTALTRLFEHDRAKADQLVASLEEQGMTSLDHAACLAVF